MQKVLVTGASGAIGVNVIKYLLSEGKYEITALDLRNKSSQKKLKRYRRRINLIYGDINDGVLMDALIKDHDYVIHLASVLPPLADIKKNISELVEYKGTKNIINSIKNYNPKCFLIYASSTTVYGKNDIVKVGSKSKLTELDYYSHTKLKIEKLISEKLENYTILRVPLVLTNPKSGAFIYNVKRSSMIEAITDNDAGYAFVRAIKYKNELKGNKYNLTGGEATTGKYADILARVLDIYGLSIKYILTTLFIDKNFYGHIYEDGNDLEEILEFRSDSLSSFYMRLKRQVKHHYIRRVLAKPFIFVLRRIK